MKINNIMLHYERLDERYICKTSAMWLNGYCVILCIVLKKSEGISFFYTILKTLISDKKNLQKR